jgi:hypothetical protein
MAKRMRDPYRYFVKRLLLAVLIYLAIMAELGFLKGRGIL